MLQRGPVVNTRWSAEVSLLVTVADGKQTVVGGRLERFGSLSIVCSVHNKSASQGVQKLEPEQDRQTDARD